MIRGLQLRGELIRSLRLAKGWSQLDLAQRAGVGERTIRNAESGRIIEGSTASYIAGALEITLEKLVKPPADPAGSFSISHLDFAFREVIFNGRTAPLQEMLTTNFIWRIVGIPINDTISVARSFEQLSDVLHSVRSHLSQHHFHTWRIVGEESAILNDTFVMVSVLTSQHIPPRRYRCHTVGRLEHQRCSHVTQTWDEVVMEQ